MIGIPPATLASNPIGSFLELCCNSYLWYASIALFAVTTDLPFAKAFFTTLNASSIPPINSTTISILSSSNMSSILSLNFISKSRSFFRFLTTPMSGTISLPALAVIMSLFFCSIFTTLLPTVPTPIIPTFIII